MPLIDQHKTKKELIREIAELRLRLAHHEKGVRDEGKAFSEARPRDREERFPELRRQSEHALKQRPAEAHNVSNLSFEELQRLVYELEAHQIELEMQSQELHKTQLELINIAESYWDLYDSTQVGYLILDKKGEIRDANLTGANLLGVLRQQLIKRPLSTFVLKEDRDTFYIYWARVLETETKEACEIQLQRKDGSFSAQLETLKVRDTEGEFTELFRTAFWDTADRIEAEKRQKELNTFQALYDLALSMTSDRDIDETLLMVVEQARNLLGTDTAYIALRDEKAQDVYMRALSGITTEAFRKLRVPFGSGLGGKVAITGKGFIVTNYFTEIEPTVHEIVRAEGLISGVAVPIQIGRTNLGVLYAFNRAETAFSKSHLDTLSLLGNLAAIEIVRKRQEIDLLKAFENLEQKVERRTAELSKANQRLKDEINQREKAEALLRSILAASPVGIGLTENRIIKWANEAWMTMFGFEHENEFVGKSAAILYSSEEEYERVGSALYEGLVTDQITATDAVFKRKDGSLFDGSIRMQGLQAPHLGQEAISAISDISDRKRAEKMLQESQERLKLAIAGADLGWWDSNVQKDETVLSEEGAAILGYSLDELEPNLQLWKELIHPDDASLNLNLLQKHLEGHTAVFETEHRLRTKSGEWKWILARGKIVERDPSGNPLRMAGTFLDVTDRKIAQEALRQSEQRFRAIFEGAEDYIFLKDRSLRYTQVNPAFEKLAGVPASEIIGKRHEDVFGSETSEFISDMDLRALGGETVEDEHGKTIRGIPMNFLATRTPLRDASGEIVGILIVLHDITDRKRAEASLLPAKGGYPSKAMRAALDQARMAATKTSTVLLTGESGSGKDYLARYIHDHSPRAGGPYFSVNCAAISPELAESELFGHERGSFTGAHARKRGLLELAEGGTLLLNEIGELSLPLQSKLLTFLDTRKFTRVGGEREITVNARLIAATNRELERDVTSGTFRKDLYYRINVISIEVPPLRKRVEDIPLLVQEILIKLCDEMQIHEAPVIGPAVMGEMKRHDWPGNVRELRNVLERALIVSQGKKVDLSALGFHSKETSPSQEADKESFSVSFPSELSLNEVTRELKRFMVNEALRRSGGSRQGAAKLLGISRYSLTHYMKTLGYAIDGE